MPSRPATSTKRRNWRFCRRSLEPSTSPARRSSQPTSQLQTDYILEVLEPDVQVCLADAIMMHLDGLRCSLERYRNYVENADARTRGQLALRLKANPEF